eukprot:TRINITY_DN16261_c0_g1_i3.p1 TRINITY_DN16261_c0_g1~~TRINITY_DN16261_c0_g1_i3.p1  ORF type:complete len:455 (-),score=42.12 TRINITY_DN16261_c0_g1_i3:100-1311(-)
MKSSEAGLQEQEEQDQLQLQQSRSSQVQQNSQRRISELYATSTTQLVRNQKEIQTQTQGTQLALFWLKDGTVVTSQDLVNAIAKELNQLIGPLPDDFLQKPAPDLPLLQRKKQKKNNLMKFSAAEMPETVGKELGNFLQTFEKDGFTTYRQRETIARSMLYLHKLKGIPWESMQLKDLFPKGPNAVYIQTKEMLNWLSVNFAHALRTNLMLIRYLLLLAEYLQLENIGGIEKQIYDVKSGLKKEQDKWTSGFTWDLLMTMFVNIRSHVQRKKVYKGQILENNIAWGLVQTFQLLFGLCYQEKDIINIKVCDVTKQGDKYVIQINKNLVLSLPQYFTKEMEFYLESYRQALSPQSDALLLKQDGSSISTDYVGRTISRMGELFAKSRCSKGIVLKACREYFEKQ